MSSSSTLNPSLLGLLLEEQEDLTAVERFAQRHEAVDGPLLAEHYEALLPAAVPDTGEQYAFRVDLDACTGCKACVTACHNLNGLDEGETWRRVGRLVGDEPSQGLQQTVTTACHHCVDPGCLRGCPVNAYEKDPVTGIVRHLDDQCIGCQYCTLTCPYDVPQYSASRGIVRKCDMCAGRLAVGEAPACVQGCPNGAISIAIVPTEPNATGQAFLPAMANAVPSVHLTQPVTEYDTERLKDEALVPADVSHVEPAPAHWPLAVLLWATQLSVGTLSIGLVASAAADSQQLAFASLVLAAAAAAGGQVAAIFHLGRPHLAYRAVLGLRTSWMSREIAVLGLYVGGLLGAICTTALFGWAPATLAIPVAIIGWVGLYASAMIYVSTGRPWWASYRTFPSFAVSAMASGLAALIFLSLTVRPNVGVAAPLLLALWAGLFLRARTEERDLRSLGTADSRSLRRTSELLRTVLSSRNKFRSVLAVLSTTCWALGVVLLLASGPAAVAAALGCAGFALFGVSELIGRNLFFTAEASVGMPGN